MDASRYKSEEEHVTLGFWEILWRGFAMGVAELVPGISGGTVAFITNIYLGEIAYFGRSDIHK